MAMKALAGRFRARRLSKRFLTILGALAGVLLLLSVLFYLLITSNFFWRQFVVPRFLGPYWETALYWEDIDLQVYPPGVSFQNVVFKEPGDDGEHVVTIRELRAIGGWRTRPDFIDLKDFAVRGVSVNIIRYSATESNLTRAMARLFEGRPPSASGRDLPRNVNLIPAIFVHQGMIRDVTIRVEDRSDPSLDPLVTVLESPDPVLMRFDPGSQGFVEGRLDRFLGLSGMAKVSISRNGTGFEGEVDFEIDSPMLGLFPQNEVQFSLELSPARKEYPRISMAATSPLERLAIRAVAVPFDDLRVLIEDPAREVAVRLDRADFDPLRGALDGDIAGDFPVRGLLDAVAEFFPGLSFDEVLRQGGYAAAADFLKDLDVATRVTTDMHLHFEGIGQYAAVDPGERMPLRLVTEGTLSLTDLDPNMVPAWRETWGGAWHAEQTLPKTLIAQALWRFEMSETARDAGIFLDVDIAPMGWEASRLGMELQIGARDDAEAKVRFNPFGPRVSRAVAQFLEEAPVLEPRHEFLPHYEGGVRAFGQPVGRLMALLEALEMAPATFRQTFLVRDEVAVRALLAPFLGGMRSGATGMANIVMTHAGPGGFSTVRNDFVFDDLLLDDIEGAVRLAGEMEFVRMGNRLTAAEFDVRIEREQTTDAGEPPVLQLELSRGGLDGELGPSVPTYIDLESGDAHFEITANTMSREIVEILLRVQSFGVSQQLSTPFYSRLLDVLGFTPGDPGARGKARLSLSGQLGETFRIASQVNFDALPIRGMFRGAGGGAASEGGVFNARLYQQTALDRVSLLFHPERFELLLLAEDADSEFAFLRLEPEPRTAIDYKRFSTFAEEEMALLAEADAVDAKTPLRVLLAGFLDRARRLGGTIHSGGADLVFGMPETALVTFAPLLEEAGVPVEEGVIDLELRARVERGADLPDTGARGAMRLSGLRLRGMDAPLPETAATLDLRQRGTIIELSNLTTTIRMAPGFPVTTLFFGGRADIESLASSWQLRLEDINASVLGLLQRLEDGGISIAARILDALPAQRLADIAGSEGSVDLEFDGETADDGREFFLRARQSGRNLLVFPRVLEPLSFDLATAIRVYTDGRLRIEEVAGVIREEGMADPILTTYLDSPVYVGAADEGSGDAVLTVQARKDLEELSGLLGNLPLPFYGRPITGGIAMGRIDMRFPGGLLATDFERLELENDIDLSIKGLTLDGWPRSIDSTLRSLISTREGGVEVSRAELVALVDGEPSGAITASAVYTSAEDRLEAVVDLIGFRDALLDPLPQHFSRWTSQPDARVDAQARINSQVNAGRGTVTMALRAREIGLPAIESADGAFFSHPPIHADADLVSSYDVATSTALLQDFALFVSGGSVEPGPRLAQLDRATSALLRAETRGPFAMDLWTWGVARQSEEGTALTITVGPLDVERYGVLVQQVAGVPLASGRLAGEVEVVARTVVRELRNELRVALRLDEGVWEGQKGPEELRARLELQGSAQGRDLVVEQLDARIEYPGGGDDSQDHIRARGSYNTAKNLLRMGLESDQIAIDRLIRYAGDVQGVYSRLYPEGVPRREGEDVSAASPSNGEGLLEKLDGRLDVRIRRLTYGEIVLPDTRAAVSYKDSILSLEEFSSRSVGSRIGLWGSMDLSDASGPWDLALEIRNLPTRPWVNSFGPAILHERVSGRLTADALVTGKGFQLEALRDSLESSLVMQVSDLDIQLPQVEGVFGAEGEVDAKLRLLVRNNRAVFDLVTPWNSWRHISARGSLRNVVALEGEDTHYTARARLVRMTPVGPAGRTLEWRGRAVPFRQEVIGVTVEAQGTLNGREGGIRVHNVTY